MSTFGNMPPAAPPTARAQSNGMAIAGMVCGIVGILIFSVILGPLAIIFGGIGLSRANSGASGRGMARAGIILGIVDIALFVVFIALATTHGNGSYFHLG
jgi:hypothetical protein